MVIEKYKTTCLGEPRKELVIFHGPAGCGKSTALKERAGDAVVHSGNKAFEEALKHAKEGDVVYADELRAVSALQLLEAVPEGVTAYVAAELL